MNGAGKSTVVQAMLLAREAASAYPHATVRLNGPFGLQLGTAEHIRNWDSADSIEIAVQSEVGEPLVWRFGVPSDSALYLTVDRRPEGSMPFLTDLPRAFTYLNAERLGPRSLLPVAPLPSLELEVGVHGEHCAQVISELGGRPLEQSDRAHPDQSSSDTKLLTYQVERWLRDIVRPIELAADRHADSMAALRFRLEGGDWVAAPNMGFGVSYSLPIVLGGLISMPGGVVIVENPEAHLHPAGQSRMGVFLAWLASRGVQVLVETHSDHVLNGVRRGIGEFEYLGHDQANVLYFEADSAGGPIVHDLSFTRIGGIDKWPSGFFDQYQLDVAHLGRIRRKSP